METETRHITLRSAITWIVAVFLGISGLMMLFSEFFAGVFVILTSLVIFPPTSDFVFKKWNLKFSRGVKVVLSIIFLAISGSFISSDNNLSPQTTAPEVTTSNPVQNSSSSNTQAVQDNAKDRKITSIVFAKEIIKNLLKSPSTAKFSNVAAYELSNKKDVWAVNGYVDSQNSYGAMIRNIWEVQLDYRDGKGGTVSSILFDGKKIQ